MKGDERASGLGGSGWSEVAGCDISKLGLWSGGAKEAEATGGARTRLQGLEG